MAEFSLAKFYTLFGISKVKSAAQIAFRPPVNTNNNNNNNQYSSSHLAADDQAMSLSSLETIADTLLEIIESCGMQMDKRNWLQTWSELARRFAFQYNPALQPRAIIVYGCIAKTATESDFKQLLRMLVKALESHSGIDLIEAIVICMTRLLPLLPAHSTIHKFMFWIAVCILQLEDASLYAAGLALLEQNLHTLETNGALDAAVAAAAPLNAQPGQPTTTSSSASASSLERILMEAREPLEWQFKQLDQVTYSTRHLYAIISSDECIIGMLLLRCEGGRFEFQVQVSLRSRRSSH